VDQAIDVLAQGIEQVEQPAPLYNKLALILAHQLQDYPRAVELLQLALQAVPGEPVYQRNLQQILHLQATQREQAVRQQRRYLSVMAKKN
jgi:hypothetical protein